MIPLSAAGWGRFNMQLVTFERHGAEENHSMGDRALGFEGLEPSATGARRLGALVPHGRHAGSVVDLNRALALKLATEDVGAPEAEADSLLATGVLAFLRGGERAAQAARAAFDFALDALDRYDAPDVQRRGWWSLAPR